MEGDTKIGKAHCLYLAKEYTYAVRQSASKGRDHLKAHLKQALEHAFGRHDAEASMHVLEGGGGIPPY